MKWITREHVKVDRVACPWLIRKFVDQNAEFIFAPADKVMDEAKRLDAIPYDVKNVELGHHGQECSFEAILKKYKLTGDPALVLLGESSTAPTPTTRSSNQPEGPGLEADCRRLPPPRLQGRPRTQRRGVDRLRRTLCLLPGDGAARQSRRHVRLGLRRRPPPGRVRPASRRSAG